MGNESSLDRLWHGISIFNCHLQGPVTLKTIAERSAVELKLPVFTIRVCRDWDEYTQPFAYAANALTNCATAAIYLVIKIEYTPNNLP